MESVNSQVWTREFARSYEVELSGVAHAGGVATLPAPGGVEPLGAVTSDDAPDEDDVRESMRRLPAWLQPLLTWVTGKPLVGQEPLWRSTPWSSLATALVLLGVGTAASAWISLLSPVWWGLLPGSWIITVGAARKLQVSIMHHCVHAKFTGNRRVDMMIAEVLSILLLVQNAVAYLHEHVSEHHTKALATLSDPDFKFLLMLGFRPGMSVQALWRRMVLTCVDPRFHLLFLRFRFTSNFVSPSPWRRIVAAVYAATLLAVVALWGAWVPFVVAWVIPVTVLYHVSALLQFTSEHKWLRVRDPLQPRRLFLARLTSGRFSGEAAPPRGLPRVESAAAWTRWGLRMTLVHLPARAIVLVGDLPQHDWHHRMINREWPDAAYSRQRDLQAGCPGWPERYSEVWGLVPALHAVFQVLSAVPPVAEETVAMTLGEVGAIMGGM